MWLAVAGRAERLETEVLEEVGDDKRRGGRDSEVFRGTWGEVRED